MAAPSIAVARERRMIAAEAPKPILARAGDWLRKRQRAIFYAQWAVVVIYAFLLVAPVVAPPPDRSAHIWNNVTLFAQFAFWGIWWPFVLLSMILVGRSWCGFFCPEGALTENVSKFSLGRAVPKWVRWKGWPFAAFACTTIYGQMVSVYQYPKPVLIVLGGSTLAAMAIAFLYGRDKRVWCRYLCPVNGVFGLLSKLSPIHYNVDRKAWARAAAEHPHAGAKINCAPLVPIRTMQSASPCHMCGRCSGFKNAVALEARSPSHEIVRVAGAAPNPWETILLVFGMIGLACGAFQWTASPWFADAKNALAEVLVERGWTFALEPHAPWWIFTNYPEQNDVMTLLDGGLVIAYIAAASLIVGGLVSTALALSVRALGSFDARRFHHLAQALIPIAACGLFLGLFSITVSMLKAEGFSTSWIGAFRALALTGASLWSLWLAWSILGLYASARARRVAATGGFSLALGAVLANWILLFWIW